MPIFDYECKCGEKAVDKLVRTSDAKVECPKCGETMQKAICAPGGFLLMGEGFYKQHDAPASDW